MSWTSRENPFIYFSVALLTDTRTKPKRNVQFKTDDEYPNFITHSDVLNQEISSHTMDPVFPKYSGHNTRKVNNPTIGDYNVWSSSVQQFNTTFQQKIIELTLQGVGWKTYLFP